MFSLGNIPPVNSFLTSEEFVHEKSYPLDLYFCQHCFLVQLGDLVDSKKLFSHYLHMSSASQSNILHLHEVTEILDKRIGLSNKKILEIGSNDGTLLESLRDRGARVLGVDPAKNLADLCKSKGIEIINDFFLKETADQLSLRTPFDIVIALNVLAHTPNFPSLLEGVKKVLAPDGTLIIEAAYVVETILEGQFDTIYHEHVYCFSLHSLSYALKKAGFEVSHAEIISTQGSSLRVFAQHRRENKSASTSAKLLLEMEKQKGYTDSTTYKKAGEKVERFKKNFTSQLHQLVSAHGPLIALGAPARGVVLMNYCHLNLDLVKYVIDDTPLKQGRYMAGTHTPVHSWEILASEKKPPFLLLSWNYKSEILQKLSRYFPDSPVLIPFPEIKIEH